MFGREYVVPLNLSYVGVCSSIKFLVPKMAKKGF